MMVVMAKAQGKSVSSVQQNRIAMKPSFHYHELYLLFNPETELGRKTLAVAQSVNRVIHQVNILDKTVTPLYWKEVSVRLGLSPLELLIPEHPDYRSLFGGRQFSEQDVLEILFHHPELVKWPIGIHQNKAVLCDDPKDILKLDFTPVAERAAYNA